jgi:hypothetical protein
MFCTTGTALPSPLRDQLWGLQSHPLVVYRFSPSGIKWEEREDVHSPPSSAEVKCIILGLKDGSTVLGCRLLLVSVAAKHFSVLSVRMESCFVDTDVAFCVVIFSCK